MNIASDLFLLLLNLSQMRNRSKVIELFLDSLGVLFAPRTFRHADRGPAGSVPSFPITTRNSTFGQIVPSEAEPLSEEDQALLHNATQMLAVILDRLDFEQELAAEKSSVERTANERLQELLVTVEQLQQSRTASINVAEDLSREIDSRRQAVEALRVAQARTQELLTLSDESRAALLDATEDARESEQESARTAREWQTTFDAMDEAIWILDKEHHVLRSNQTAERFFQRPCQEMLGEHCYTLVHGIAAPHADCPFVRACQSGHRETLELQAGERWLAIDVDPLCDAAGQSAGAVHIVSDITERVRGEAARAQLQANLNQAQKIEALGTLAAGIAHDFNNLVGAIIGNAELARQDVGPSHPALESIEEIRKASLRAKDLVQRILAFGRPQQQPESVIALRPVVEDSLTLLRATLPAGVEIAATFDAETPAALADPTLIQQIVINLCTNAWHAMQGHAGRIDIRLEGVTLSAEAPRVHAHLQAGHFARLSVTDTGSGMDSATLERIFDPFFTTKPVGHGTGLGLSVVHGIMQAHGGAVTVTSQPGRGTTFRLYFPAVETPEQHAAPHDAAPQPLPAAAGQHVLYLDDEESLVFLMTRALKRLGYRVTGYTRAAEALAAVQADPAQFDLVVTDFNMPGLSGLDVARELARLRPDLPVVLASGYITDELRAQAPQAGVRELIYKPNTVDELCEAVQRLMGATKHSQRP